MASPTDAGAILLLWLLVCKSSASVGNSRPNYRDALGKSIMFFQGQRSGRLPRGQLITWHAPTRRSMMVNLTGGYYDAGDNAKFNFLMAFTTTMLSWSALEFGGKMKPQKLNSTRITIHWATDYLLKCSNSKPGVGDPNADHHC
ncbi:Endoglucanase 9-like protein [Drosera capensis]